MTVSPALMYVGYYSDRSAAIKVTTGADAVHMVVFLELYTYRPEFFVRGERSHYHSVPLRKL